jgi:KDO2-lipid IV(A) lauroyltransferase
MTSKFNTQFLMPKFWATWAGLSLLRLIRLFPFNLQVGIGSLLGNLIYLTAKKRRQIAETNLALCFPEHSDSNRKQMTKEVFKNSGIGLIETACAWWAPVSSFDSKTKIEGRQYLDEALLQGKGVILLGAHYSTLDLGGLLFSRFYNLHTMYRPHNNPLMESIIDRGRKRFISSLIDRHDFRGVIRALKSNEIVWYAPDQDFGPTNSVYAPFFGVEAATVTATARLAKLSKSPIVMLSHHRNSDNSYTLRLHPPVEPFPLEGDRESATRINQEIEKGILYDPTQYMWMHRRFKTHPNGKGFMYRSES